MDIHLKDTPFVHYLHDTIGKGYPLYMDADIYLTMYLYLGWKALKFVLIIGLFH